MGPMGLIQNRHKKRRRQKVPGDGVKLSNYLRKKLTRP